MQQIQSKLFVMLQSRKFWATIFGLASIGIALQFGHIPLEGAETGVLGILSAYILSVAIEDHGWALSRKAPDTTYVTPPTASPSSSP